MSEHTPTTDLDLDHLEALANQKRGHGYHEEQALIGAVPALVAEVRRLRAQVEQLENQLDEVRALVGPDNESGMVSASAIFHTIGTGNQ